MPRTNGSASESTHDDGTGWYDFVDFEIVWEILTDDLPVVADRVRDLPGPALQIDPRHA
ncbi:hypothetical protein GCM10028784_25590 [Myceligenerans cantabricum]